MTLGELGIGEGGRAVSGPPWILGQRGVPRSAPENTLAGFRAGLELGLDGLAYDLRANATGERIVLADASLERTAGMPGLARSMGWAELAGFDVGASFHRKFAGQRVPRLEEVLALASQPIHVRAQHVILLREDDLVEALASELHQSAAKLSVRVASPRQNTLARASALGLSALWIVDRITPRVLEIARQERFAALAAPLNQWRDAAQESVSLPFERWALALESPEEMLLACQVGLHAFTTKEPERAMAARAMFALGAGSDPRWPLEVDALDVACSEPAGGFAGQAPGQMPDWTGRWNVRARASNPWPFAVRAQFSVQTRRGTFQVGAVPVARALEVGESIEFDLFLGGGSWSPGGDPRLVVELSWQKGPGRPAERLCMDHELARVRRTRVAGAPLRLSLLRESASDPPASVILARSKDELLVSIENDAGLLAARLVVLLDGVEYWGARGLRAGLPADFASRPGGVPFVAGIVGGDPQRPGAPPRWRRSAGGLPRDGDSGAPGRLEPAPL